MKITNFRVMVGLTITQNAGDYTNIKPTHEITLEGEMNAFDWEKNYVELYDLSQALHDMVRENVHAQIDNELEIRERKLVYHDGPLYSLVHCEEEDYFAIVASRPEHLPPFWEQQIPHGFRELRYNYLYKKINGQFPPVADQIQAVASEALPILEEFTSLIPKTPYQHLLVLLSGDRRWECVGMPRLWYDRKKACQKHIMTRAGFLAKMEKLAEQEGIKIINCLDDDFSALLELPEPPELPEEESPEDDIPFNEGEGWDEDE